MVQTRVKTMVKTVISKAVEIIAVEVVKASVRELVQTGTGKRPQLSNPTPHTQTCALTTFH